MQLSNAELNAKCEEATLQAQNESGQVHKHHKRAEDLQEQLSAVQLDLQHERKKFKLLQQELETGRSAMDRPEKASPDSKSHSASLELQQQVESKMEECRAMGSENKQLQDECHRLRAQMRELVLEKEKLEAGQ